MAELSQNIKNWKTKNIAKYSVVDYNKSAWSVDKPVNLNLQFDERDSYISKGMSGLDSVEGSNFRCGCPPGVC